MNNFVVVGGGTAGWITALFIKKNVPYSEVTVIASSEIGILGAGEGTTPPFIKFLENLNISVEDIIKHAKGTIKNGIKFTNWNGDGSYYYHPFWEKNSIGLSEELCNNSLVNYNKLLEKQDIDALHFDANLLAKYLQTVGLKRGINLIDDEVVEILQNEKEYITGLKLKSNTIVDLDFVFDCSGFKRLIIGKHYKSQWNSYADILPVNRAMPFFLDNANENNLPPYTEAIAMKYGWMWKIPVQGRYGCGYVFDSSYVTDEEIKQELEDYLEHEIKSPRMFNFDAGCYEKTWIKNCIAIGLSSGFSEPLEATSIWIQTTSLEYFLYKINGILLRDDQSIEEYNNGVNRMNYDLVNFIQFHYLSQRKDSGFWRNFETKTKKTQTMKSLLEICKDRLPIIGDMVCGENSILKTYKIDSWYLIGNGTKRFNVDLYTDKPYDTKGFINHSEYIDHVNLRE
jgi:tryptophan halogenase